MTTEDAGAGAAPLFVHEEGEHHLALLALHGLGGSWRYWEHLLPTMTEHRRVVAPDLLGFGRSPWPEGRYSMQAHLDALMPSVLPRLGERFDVVGHSFGALVALEVAARVPERIRTITLLALPYYEDEATAEHFVKTERWGRLILERPAVASATCQLVCQRRRVWRHVLPHLVREFPRHVVEDAMLHSYHSISSTLIDGLVRHRQAPAAGAVRDAGLQVRIVSATDDAAAPPSRARAFAARFGNASVEALADRGHAFPLKTARWNRSLLACACVPHEDVFQSGV